MFKNTWEAGMVNFFKGKNLAFTSFYQVVTNS